MKYAELGWRTCGSDTFSPASNPATEAVVSSRTATVQKNFTEKDESMIAWHCTVDGFHADELGSGPNARRLLGLIPDRSPARMTSESVTCASSKP